MRKLEKPKMFHLDGKLSSRSGMRTKEEIEAALASLEERVKLTDVWNDPIEKVKSLKEEIRRRK